MTQFAVGFLDSLFGEKLTIELPGPEGTVLKRTVTKKWFERMQREQKIREMAEPVVRAHVLSPLGYRVQHWVIGREMDDDQCQRFRDADTGDLYVLTYFEAGEEKQKMLVKHVWEQAKAQMDGVGR